MVRTLPLLVALFLSVPISACSYVPTNYSSPPKEIEIDGTSHIACGDVIWIYSPSRNIADSTKKTYEITFTDDYGQPQDFKEVQSYTIRKIENATYAMPDPLPGPKIRQYSNGVSFRPGEVVLLGKRGDAGRAKFIGPGNWKPVPCGS